MSSYFNRTRRDFMKTAALTAAATGVVPGMLHAKTTAGIARFNPNIDNLDVVYIKDTKMKDDKSKIGPNLDKMAVALTGGNLSAKDAWKKIFYLPAGKQYSAAKVCIKINAMHTPFVGDAQICAHVCNKLNELGIPYGNITVFDSGGWTSHKATERKSVYQGGGVNSAVKWDGDKTMVKVDAGGKSYGVYTKLGNGTYDMMVNLAPHKGHIAFGRLTCALKSVVGTWDHAPGSGSLSRSKPSADTHANPTYVNTVNKSSLMLNTHRLHIINSIRASREDPSSNDAMPGIILMGTFAGAVDWLIVDKIRKPLGFPNGPNTNYRAHNQKQQQCEPKLFIEGFGYATSDPRWVDASSSVVDVRRAMSRDANGVYQTAFSTRQGPMLEIGTSGYHSGAILDLHGREIVSFDGYGYRTYAVRDLMHKSGLPQARGTYFVRLHIGNQTYNEHVFIAQ